MLTLERLQEVLEYNPDSGVWVWKLATGKKNTPGKIAGWLDDYGYIGIRIDRRLYKAHRLAWLYMTGEWPRTTIDHINLEPADNRWVNLREATYSQNNANRKPTARNKSGRKGVSWDTKAKKWRAQLSIGKRARYIGLFDSVDEASLAYEAVAREAYGEFFRQ